MCIRDRVKAFTSQAEIWVLESQLRQTLVVKTGSDNSIVQRSVIGVSVTNDQYKRMPCVTVGVAR